MRSQLLPHGFIHKAEIKDLARWYLLGALAQAFLGKLDGAFHPRFVGRAVGGKAAQVKFKERFGESLIFDVEVTRQDLDRFAAVLPREL